MNYKLLLFFFIIVCTCFFTACQHGTVYEKSIALPAHGWTYNAPVQYRFPIADSTKTYNLWLDVTHKPDFSYQNIYVQIDTKYPAGQQASDKISLELADKTGMWYGNCGGKTCELSIPLQTKAYFNQAGEYSITLAQYTRRDSLPGILALGFRVEDTGEKRQ